MIGIEIAEYHNWSKVTKQRTIKKYYGEEIDPKVVKEIMLDFFNFVIGRREKKKEDV